jgi:hypothetical protein
MIKKIFAIISVILGALGLSVLIFFVKYDNCSTSPLCSTIAFFVYTAVFLISITGLFFAKLGLKSGIIAYLGIVLCLINFYPLFFFFSGYTLIENTPFLAMLINAIFFGILSAFFWFFYGLAKIPMGKRFTHLKKPFFIGMILGLLHLYFVYFVLEGVVDLSGLLFILGITFVLIGLFGLFQIYKKKYFRKGGRL